LIKTIEMENLTAFCRSSSGAVHKTAFKKNQPLRVEVFGKRGSLRGRKLFFKKVFSPSRSL